MTEKRKCSLCAKVMLLLVCAGLGVVAGLGADMAGASSELSMTATFFGALVPLLWWARRSRDSHS